jgi:acetate---CoA ligase (ADP-forming)
MHALDCLIRPRSVAVIGASAKRKNNGNVVVINLRAAAFGGTVIPIHAEAAEIEGYACARTLEDLPAGVDVGVVSVPAPGVLNTLQTLDRVGVGSAIVMSSGFTAAEEAAIRDFTQSSRLRVQGPNCMGLLNMTDGIPLYTAIPSTRVQPGRAALIAQSGSAAISVMNSTDVGFSKVITSGSQHRLSTADFIDWLATDDSTAVIGMVIESVPDADRFADAVDRAYANGKACVVLKVGQSDLGAMAAQAHTGALISHRDATMAYFRRYGIPTVDDYDALIAALDVFATTRSRPARNRIGIAGISGGEAALTCDLADSMGIPIAAFADTTVEQLKTLLPGTAGLNPIDFGAAVSVVGTSNETAALHVIAADPNVDTLFILQDAQHSLAWRSSGRYVGQCKNVAELGEHTDKPIVVVSSSGEALHPDIKGALAGTHIPLLRGLRPALAAMACMGVSFGRIADPRRLENRSLSGEKTALRTALGKVVGPLSGALTARLLTAYGLPLVRSAVAATADEAALRAGDLGYPLVVKVVSRDVPHRSDIGAVQLGIRDEAGLRAAIAAIATNVRLAVPNAVIEGYELQEELTGAIEAAVGFKATPPYGALIVVGTGGTLVELQDDRALSLSPVTPAEATGLIQTTRLGALLRGYRNLIPATDLAPLAALVTTLSGLAADMHDVLAECDLNPVFVRPGSGDVRIVDALFIASGPSAQP